MNVVENKRMVYKEFVKRCDIKPGTVIQNNRYGLCIAALHSSSSVDKMVFAVVNLIDGFIYHTSGDEGFIIVNAELIHEPLK